VSQLTKPDGKLSPTARWWQSAGIEYQGSGINRDLAGEIRQEALSNMGQDVSEDIPLRALDILWPGETSFTVGEKQDSIAQLVLDLTVDYGRKLFGHTNTRKGYSTLQPRLAGVNFDPRKLERNSRLAIHHHSHDDFTHCVNTVQSDHFQSFVIEAPEKQTKEPGYTVQTYFFVGLASPRGGVESRVSSTPSPAWPVVPRGGILLLSPRSAFSVSTNDGGRTWNALYHGGAESGHGE